MRRCTFGGGQTLVLRVSEYSLMENDLCSGAKRKNMVFYPVTHCHAPLRPLDGSSDLSKYLEANVIIKIGISHTHNARRHIS